MVLAWHGVEGLGTLYTVGRSYWGQLLASLSLSHNELTSSHGVGWGGKGARIPWLTSHHIFSPDDS
jgi:hypothetical protein